MNWLLFLKYENGEFVIKQAGSNIVPTEAFDKVLPTTEKIARQSDKVYFDGQKLRLKEGETLLPVEELATAPPDLLTEPDTVAQIFDIE